MNCITVPLYLALKEKYNDRIVETANILEPLREIKSEEELGKIRVAASIADEVYARLRKAVKPGISECKIYSVVKQAIHEMGCEYSMDFIDAAGSTMNLTGYPTMDELEAGGTLFMEVTPSYEGYYGQLPLTLPVTEYSSTVRPMVSAWNKADKELRKILRPGTQVSDIAKILINTVKENGFISPMRPGHSVGLDALDFWSVTEDSAKVLQPGMALALHASVMSELGGDACGMGYTYFITDTGYEKPSKIDLAQELIGE
jgi:Xaa-Pro dipeptidase